jgi:hypothetical protein
MAEQHHEPLTEEEMASLAQRLSELGKGLSPKEKWFLTESLKSGIMANNAADVTGYTMGSALKGGTMYYPAAYQDTYGQGETINTAESAAFPTISVKVTIHF